MKDPAWLFDFKRRHDVIWFGNMNQEQSWDQTRALPVMTDHIQNELVLQQEQQLLLIASKEHHVILHHQPDPAFLAYLEKEGVQLPHITQKEDAYKLKGLIVPYLLDESVEQAAMIENREIYGSNSTLVKRLNHKISTRRWAEEHQFTVTCGSICHHAEELKQTYEKLKANNFSKMVLKIPYGSSGKGLRILKSEREFMQLLTFIKRRNIQTDLLLEGWHPIKRSLNAQLLIQEEESHLLSITEQKISEDGIYLGTDFAPVYELDKKRAYESSMHRIIELLYEEGYRGVVGVDSIIDENEQLIPIIEINARFTQVTYLLPIICRFFSTYEYIESRFKRFSCSADLPFEEVLTEVTEALNPGEDGGVFIYTFGKTKVDDMWHYRLFILLYHMKKDKQDHMLTLFDDMAFSSERGREFAGK
ncbi:ATP-grasp domain-containing protein [Bacillus pumilus]|uniref:ATP-grasp domain-containing protein n=1 Tax=Bacillus pumilus TaxID=1408 RepID=UPI0011E935D2|nr:ATP-grasp domain-containing protein [Bacillus pumilus]TYS32531.1 ATP-grasp domain-containing protein [Bacillus pumilus]TYS49691.1 ATP-grasp domain-containing protein [Bacillus pumilus]